MNPLCRHFLICADGHITDPGERVVVEQPNGPGLELADHPALVLANPLHVLAPEPGRRYPAIIPRVVLFAQLTNGTGSHRMGVELIRWYQGQQFQVFPASNTPLDFGTDPLNVVQYWDWFDTVIFPVAAQYSFRLLCNGQEIGQAEVELREP